MSENHNKFLSHLKCSSEAVDFARRWLVDQGYDVLQKAVRSAPDASQWEEYADDGDLYIQQRIEVKKLGVKFTPTHWPFGAKFIVCAKHAFDRSKPKPFAFIILSSDLACAACLRSSTKERWSVEKRKDSRYESVTQEFYFAPLECVDFVWTKYPMSDGT